MRTPRSAAFHDTFHTPKLESSFFDPRVTWNTADSWSGSPEVFTTPRLLKTSQDQSVASTRRLSAQELDAELGSHVNYPSPNPNLPLPPVEASRQLSSSPNPATNRSKTSSREAGEPAMAEQTRKGRGKSWGIGGIQTPPPTSSSASKRKAQQQAYTAQLLKESAIRGRGTTATPIAAKSNAQQTPMRFPAASPQTFGSVQFSPEVFQFSSLEPQSAPALPQQKLFWGQDMSMTSAGFNPDLGEAFGPASGGTSMQQMSSIHEQGQAFYQSSTRINDFDPHSADVQMHGLNAATTVTNGMVEASFLPPFITGAPRSRPTVVTEDPSLFLSSPARRFGVEPDAAQNPSPLKQLNRQPYRHQAEESKREKELELARRASKQRIPSPQKNLDTIIEDRPNLKRSSTHSGIPKTSANLRRHSQVSFAEPVDRPDSRLSTSSPLKRMASDISTQPYVRTTLALTVDRKGRARTETRIVEERCRKAAMGMDLDLPTESETSSSDGEGFDITLSRTSSFALQGGDGEKSFGGAGHKPSLSRSHSKRSSYSSTIDSSGSGAVYSKPSTGLSGAMNNHRLRRQRKATAYDRQVEIDVDLPSEAETLHGSGGEEEGDDDGSAGNAQHALKEVVTRRKTGHQHVYTHGQHQAGSKGFLGPPSTGFLGQLASLTAHGDNSPTTLIDPDLATPSTGTGSSSSGTRCLCNGSDGGGGLMIQW